MTLVVLGIDALEPELVDRWDLEYIPLDGYGEMETYAYTKDRPLTPEVWPTIATGLGPEEHGVTKQNTSEWDNPIVDFASKFTWFLSFRARGALGDIATKVTGADHTIPETEAEGIFTGRDRVVHNWPGVTNSDWLRKVWATANPGENDTTEDEFDRSVYAIAVQQFAWAEEMLTHPATLIGVHVHLLDMGGHIYSNDEDRLREMYQWTDEWVERILSAMDEDDEMLILSDHGIVTPWSEEDGTRYGEHSWRAFSSSTTGDRPADVYDVPEWVEDQISELEYNSGTEVDIPEEQLKDLGYI
jgi:predicted AlkP superfamily pyrophosphatase or phosphodiesterase